MSERRCGGIVLVQMVEGKRRAGTVAQQPFPPGALGTLDAYRGIEREAAAMVPPGHLLRVTMLEQAAPHKGAQHLLAHPRLDLAHRSRIEPERGVKDDPGRPAVVPVDSNTPSRMQQ